jgi:hypothetical protein
VSATAPPAKTAGDRKLFILIALPLFLVFFATADRSIPYHIDPFTNVITAATIGKAGSPILEDYAELTEPGRYAVFGWVVDSPKGPVSQYPPGTALLVAPLYAMSDDPGIRIDTYAYNDPEAEPIQLTIPVLWPAALVGSLTASLAVAFSVLSVRRATGSTRWAVGSGLVLAAGTGLWLNGAYQLWQHGPAAMWIAASLWAASRAKWWSSGLLAGLAVLTRPPVAIISAGVGIVSSVRERSWIPVVKHGTGAFLGAATLLAYNYWLFDTLTISGGYGSNFTENLTGADLGWYLQNLVGGFFSLDRGLFLWSPIVAISAVGIPFVWKRSPGWATGGLLGGAVLLLIQFRLNRYSGGGGFFSYRYPIEAVVAAAPILATSARYLWEHTRLRLLVPGGALAAIALHVGALIQELRA